MKQQSRFSKGGLADKIFSRVRQSSEQRNNLAQVSQRFLTGVRNRKASPKGK